MRKTYTPSILALITAMGLPMIAQAQAAYPSTNPNAGKWAQIKLTPTLVTSANGGSGIKIGLYDGRADCTHADLVGRCTNVLSTAGTYPVSDNHGTHTAGILAGKSYGVATKASVLNYAVFDSKGYIGAGGRLADGWKQAAANGATIASMSFGCAKMALCFSDAELTTMGSTALASTLFIKAAGNDGVALGSEVTGLSATNAATALSRLILVGSINSPNAATTPLAPSSFSNRPGDGCLRSITTATCATNVQWKYHFLYAPGEMIVSTMPGGKYAYMSGTSMATPVVAATAALLQAKWPTLKAKPATVATILFTTATDLGAPGVDSVYGWGLLNITKAFQNAGTTSVISPAGISVTVNGGTASGSPVMGQTVAILGSITAYDAFGRDYKLSEVSNMKLGRNYYTSGQALGSPLTGLGDHKAWSAAFFGQRPAMAWASLGPDQAPMAGLNDFDHALRIGANMPVGAGEVQFRLTGLGQTRRDLANDTALRPLSYFASSALLNQSGLVGLSWPLSPSSQLTAFGAATSPQQIGLGQGDISQPYRLALNDPTRLDLERSPRHQTSLGAGYWHKLGAQTVIGLQASVMNQRNGFYDLTSNLAPFAKPTQVYNLGGMVSHAAGAWSLYGTAELSSLKTHDQNGPIQVSDANLISAEFGASRHQILARRPGQSDQLGLSLVMAPRAFSGALDLNYLARTPDGLGQQTVHRSVGLEQITGQPIRIETRYQIQDAKGWRMGVAAGLAVTPDAQSSLSAEFRRWF